MWAILAPVRADKAMLGLVQWLAINLGWVYVVTVASVILFIVYVAYRMEHAPEYPLRAGHAG